MQWRSWLCMYLVTAAWRLSRQTLLLLYLSILARCNAQAKARDMFNSISQQHSTAVLSKRQSPDTLKSLCIFASMYTRQVKTVNSHIAIVVRPPGRKILGRSLVICKGFFRPATPAVIWRVFQFFKEIWFGLWSCYLRMAFLDGDNFCKAFAGAQVNLSYHEWRIIPIQKSHSQIARP